VYYCGEVNAPLTHILLSSLLLLESEPTRVGKLCCGCVETSWFDSQKFALSHWKGAVLRRDEFATDNAEFVAVVEEWFWSSGEVLLLLCGWPKVLHSPWLAQGNATFWLQQYFCCPVQPIAHHWL